MRRGNAGALQQPGHHLAQDHRFGESLRADDHGLSPGRVALRCRDIRREEREHRPGETRSRARHAVSDSTSSSWRCAATKARDELIGGRAHQLVQAAPLDDFAVAHQDQVIREVARLGDVVRYEEHRLAQRTEELPELALQVVPDDRIERTERLVEQEELGIEHQRACETDPLPLPARQARRMSREVIRCRWMSASSSATRASIRRSLPAQVARHQRQVFRRRHVRKEPAFLQHVAQPMSQPVRVVRRRCLRADRDAPRLRPQQRCGRPQHRRLSATARTHEGGRAAGLDRERQPLDREPLRQPQRHVLEGEHGSRSAVAYAVGWRETGR